MSDGIVSLKLVDGNGDVRTLPHDTKHKGELSITPEEILKSAQVTLGVYGVVIEFTVKVKPMSNSTVHNDFKKRLEVNKIIEKINCSIIIIIFFGGLSANYHAEYSIELCSTR